MTPATTVPPHPTELAFTSSQAATYLGVSLATVRRWSNDGYLRATERLAASGASRATSWTPSCTRSAALTAERPPPERRSPETPDTKTWAGLPGDRRNDRLAVDEYDHLRRISLSCRLGSNKPDLNKRGLTCLGLAIYGGVLHGQYGKTYADLQNPSFACKIPFISAQPLAWFGGLMPGPLPSPPSHDGNAQIESRAPTAPRIMGPIVRWDRRRLRGVAGADDPLPAHVVGGLGGAAGRPFSHGSRSVPGSACVPTAIRSAPLIVVANVLQAARGEA